MTCRYSGTEWLDVLYTSVRNSPGGVADAANFLALRRGKSITSETLRLRLRGEGENRLSMEMFELLLEWMQEKRESEPFALDALHALNERFGLIAAPMHVDQAADDEYPHDITTLTTATLDLQAHVGEVATEVIRAVQDKRIDLQEAEALTVVSRKGQRLFERLIRTTLRLSKLRRK
ncbi:phage regulatory CII family protein [Caballeronia sp. dw_19]|uniref:phage regulatory CII family protein n=1 Tax=Caballeronia sp. dw_19 TaxID=2719791 RepID=UPI001BD4C942|nr:phage regulatory CII family protein [Caballeronia sp. dw_19]